MRRIISIRSADVSFVFISDGTTRYHSLLFAYFRAIQYGIIMVINLCNNNLRFLFEMMDFVIFTIAR